MTFKTNLDPFATDIQLSGRLMVGYGQAGHKTASSPGAVPPAPVGSWALPPRFRRCKWRHILSIRRNSWYRPFGRCERGTEARDKRSESIP